MKGRANCEYQSLVLSYFQALGLLITAALLVACNSDSSVPASGSSNAETGVISNHDIATALYFDERTPVGFYQETLQAESYYAISHVKNTDLVPQVNRASMVSHELSSDDFSEALAWSEQAANMQIQYKQLVDNSETTLYHEFKRSVPTSPEFVSIQRVFKAGMLDRSGVDFAQNQNYYGRFTTDSLNGKLVKWVVEYLWTFTNENNFGNAVLSSHTVENDNEFVHILLQARLSFNYDAGCDDIEVFESRYTVSKASGFIIKNTSSLREVRAQRVGAQISICN